MNSSIDVLVVGAGPTGLTMAGALAKHGLRVRIVDKASGPSAYSKALGVHAGTLEALGDFFNPSLSQKIVDCGMRATAANIHVDGQTIVLPLSKIPSQYNFVLVLAQSETEKILEENLRTFGITVERNKELVTLNQSEDGTVASVSSIAGEETIAAKYTIGCDGAHSATRKLSKIDFGGNPVHGQFALADVRMNWDMEPASVHIFANPLGTMACFPMTGDKHYRLVFIEPIASSNSDQLTLEEVKKLASMFGPEHLQIESTTWLTRFRIQERIAEHFREGRIFLAGDAAHIHSPAGGQGMNTGIQDAINLAYKLVQVIKHSSDPSVLNDYEKERMPVAKAVLRGTGFLLSLAKLKNNSVTRFARKTVVPKIIANAFIQKMILTNISEIKIARREIAARRACTTDVR